ncbi:MAG: hypothetical protein NC339_01045 [Muribaculaceae bacterium]|nr:hypothetical protein [Muribaculaceae bacterium]
MRQILAILLLTAAIAVCTGASPRWEAVNVPPVAATSAEPGRETGLVDVSVRDGYIYVHTNAKETVKVFTILGQLISSETLPAGTHRLRMSAKGIFILKTDTATRRVTL